MAKYIDLETATDFAPVYKYKNYINRFMELLEKIAPNKYELNTYNMLASIEDKNTNLTILQFSDNPF